MKIHYALLLCCLFVAAFPSEGLGEGVLHTFTTPDGRTLNAVIKDYNGSNGKIQIEREDEKEVWTSPSVFSKPDQEYIQQWIAADQFMSPTKFKITGKKTKKKIPMYKAHSVSSTSEVTTSEVTHVSRIEIEYEITLENKTDFPLKDLKIECRAFIFNQGSDDREDANRVGGDHLKIDEILPRGKISEKTQSINLITQFKTVVQRGYYGKTDISQKKIYKEMLKGFWVKVHGPELDGNPAIRDWCNPSDTSEDFAWQDIGSNRRQSSVTKKPKSKEQELIDEASSFFGSNPERALELFQEAYEIAQSQKVAAKIGSLYINYITPPDIPLGLEWLKKAAAENEYSACIRLAQFYTRIIKCRDGEQAIKYGRQAVSIEPEETSSHTTLATAYAFDGQFEKAVKSQERAIELYKTKSFKRPAPPPFLYGKDAQTLPKKRIR